MANGEHSNWEKNVKGKSKRNANTKKGTLAEGRRVGTLHRTLENFGISVPIYPYFAGFRTIRGFFWVSGECRMWGLGVALIRFGFTQGAWCRSVFGLAAGGCRSYLIQKYFSELAIILV